MTQKIIGLGDPDKGNGDPLRTAFGKVNDNFTELYTLVGVASLTELAQDYAAKMFTDGTHVGVTVEYDDLGNVINLTSLGQTSSGETAPENPTEGSLWWDSVSGRLYVYYGTSWVDASPADGAGISSTNELVNGNKTVSLGSEGKLTLPAGTTFEYINAPLTGHGDGLARLDFALMTDGVDAQWLAASADPAGSGYSPGDTFTFDAEFLGIPGASVTIEVITVGLGGSVEELAFTPPPLYPADIYRDSPINLQVGTTSSNRWTFGATGDLTVPGGIKFTDGLTVKDSAIGRATSNTISEEIPGGFASSTTAIANQITIDTTDSISIERTITQTVYDGVVTATDIAGSSVVVDSTNAYIKHFVEPDGPNNSSYFQVRTGNSGAIIEGVNEEVAGNTVGRVTATQGVVDISTSFEGVDKHWLFDMTGDLVVPGPIVQGDSKLEFNANGGTNVYLTPTLDDSTAVFINDISVQAYARESVGLQVGNGLNELSVAHSLLEADWVDAREADAAMAAPAIREWAGLESWLAYPILLNSNQELDPPMSPDLPPKANAAKNAYNLWQNTKSDTTISMAVGDNVWVFDADGKITLPVGGDIVDNTGTTVFKTNLSQFTNDLSVNANSLTGTTLANNVTGSSLTSVGQLTGLTSTGVVHITNTEDSINANTGSLQVDGGAHITKNLIAEGTVYAGVDAYSEVLTNPLIVASSPSGVSGGYSQVAILNNTAAASGDFQVMIDGYDVNVSDTGWADLGMAGSNFSDARYTITQPGDGYVFASGLEGSTAKGNLVLATDGSGQTNDIVFATGGFTTADEKMRLSNADGSLNIDSGVITSDNAIQLTSNGKTFEVSAGGQISIPGVMTWTNTSDVWKAAMNWNDADKFFIISSPTDFKIRTNDGQVPQRFWTFDADGNITLPAGGDIKDSTGTSVFSSTYTLPTATDTVLGGVKVDGTTITITGGVISATGGGGGGYSLPTASTTTLGGVKIDGTTITIDGSGVASAVIPTNISEFTNDSGYLTSVTTISGNAATATKLAAAVNINGVAFDGSGNITVTAAASTLSGTTLNAGITDSSLTSVGTLTNLTVTNPISGSVTGSAGSVAASALTGTTLASGVTSSSLTSVGTLANLTVTNPIAGTVQNGVVTTGTYANPSWITSLAGSKVTNAVLTTDTGTVTNTMLANSSMTLNGTLVNLGDNVTLDAAANLLMGSTLASNVTASSLTSVGTLTGLTVSGTTGLTGAVTVSTGTLTRSGNISSAAWTTGGVGLKLPAATYTDTSSSGTVANNFINVLGVPTIASTNVTTVSAAATLYIAGDPVGGTNTTVTASGSYGLYNAGKTQFVGAVRFNGALQSGGGAQMMTFSNSTISMTPGTASTAYTNGTLVVTGGVGISGNVYTNGYIAQGALPAFRVYGQGSTTWTTTSPTNGIMTSSQFSLDYQQGGTNLATSTGIFTAPVGGLYQVNLNVRTFSNASGTISQAAVIKNYDTTPFVMCMVEFGANTTMNHAGAGTVARLAAGNTLVFKILAGSIQFDANDNWSVAFLG